MPPCRRLIEHDDRQLRCHHARNLSRFNRRRGKDQPVQAVLTDAVQCALDAIDVGEAGHHQLLAPLGELQRQFRQHPLPVLAVCGHDCPDQVRAVVAKASRNGIRDVSQLLSRGQHPFARLVGHQVRRGKCAGNRRLRHFGLTGHVE
jgi:hypothetical protein